MQHPLWSMPQKNAPTNWSIAFLELEWTYQTRFNFLDQKKKMVQWECDMIVQKNKK